MYNAVLGPVATDSEVIFSGSLNSFQYANLGAALHWKDTNVWWTEGWVGMIGELQVAKAVPGTNNGVREYAYPVTCSTCGEHSSGIKVDHNGLVWFDDSTQGIFGSFPDSGQGSFSIYPAPTPQHPHDGLNDVWSCQTSPVTPTLAPCRLISTGSFSPDLFLLPFVLRVSPRASPFAHSSKYSDYLLFCVVRSKQAHFIWG